MLIMLACNNIPIMEGYYRNNDFYLLESRSLPKDILELVINIEVKEFEDEYEHVEKKMCFTLLHDVPYGPILLDNGSSLENGNFVHPETVVINTYMDGPFDELRADGKRIEDDENVPAVCSWKGLLSNEEVKNISYIKVATLKNKKEEYVKCMVFKLISGKTIAKRIDKSELLIPNGELINPEEVVVLEYTNQRGEYYYRYSKIQHDSRRLKKNYDMNIILSYFTRKWETIKNIRIKYLDEYLPFSTSREDCSGYSSIRSLIIGFKNYEDSVSESEHKYALETSINNIKNELDKYFTYDEYKALTLFCVPASTSENNIARYNAFSYLLTKRTGMCNSYDYVHIVEDAIPKHLGGTGNPIVRYESYFFKNKNILIFDDVVTTGSTILRYKEHLESIGANVIAAITLAKTIR